MKHFGIIYLLWCKVTGKKYVGQTTRTLEERFGEHCCADSYIGKAIRKHGRENFICGVIKFCATKDELNECEIFYIAALKSRAPYGYNFTDGGEGGSGRECSPETSAKLSVALRGKNNPNYGKHCTPEICMKIGASRRAKSPYKNLIAEMQTRQLTNKALAKILGLTPSAVDYKMRGKIRFTDKDKVKLVEIFGKSIEWLLASEVEISLPRREKKCLFQNLSAEMDKRQLTYKALAELLGLSPSTFSMKMRGERNFTERDEVKLVEIFGKPIEWLLASEMKNSTPRRKVSPFTNLTAEMDKRQLTYKALAELLGLSVAAVSMKMRGERNFTERDEVKLVEIFGKSIEWLLSVNNR